MRVRIGLALVTLVVVAATPAAAAQRTFVSAATGDDANLCTRAAPCRSFTPAILRADAGGEVVVLDSGGYGPFTVNKALTIIAPDGVHGAITAFSGAAVGATAGESDAVTLRGLVVSGLGGVTGIVHSGGHLTVEHCVLQDFTGNGLHRLSAGKSLTIRSSQFWRNNRGVNDSVGTMETIVIDDSLFAGHVQNGVSFFGETYAVIRGSSIFGNGGFGILLSDITDPGATGLGVVENCTIDANADGVFTVGAAAEIAVSGSTIVSSSDVNVSGAVYSRGNNTLRHGTGSFAGTFTPQ